MVTHWETSSRKLFVRTIWRDGQRHVVLQEEEERVPQTGSQNSRRSLSTARHRTRVVPQTDRSAANFKMPSVKLLLEGIRGSSSSRSHVNTPQDFQTRRSFTRSAITIDIIPGDPVKFKDLNKEVSFFPPKARCFRFSSVKSRSVETSDTISSCQNNSLFITKEKVNTTPPNSNCLHEQFKNNLSDRVLIWLDLATQNPADKHSEIKKRIATAHVCPVQKKPRPSTRPPIIPKYRYAEVVEDKSVVLDQEKFERGDISDRSILKGKSVDHFNNVSNEKVLLPSVENREASPLVMERGKEEEYEEQYEDYRDNVTNFRIGRSKRQLHIFLPNLPKKLSECDSILSSKTSSLINSNINC